MKPPLQLQAKGGDDRKSSLLSTKAAAADGGVMSTSGANCEFFDKVSCTMKSKGGGRKSEECWRKMV